MKTTKTFTFLLVIMTSLLVGYGQNLYAESGQSDVVEMQEFKDIKAKADKGDIEAQCWLASCYNSGLFGCKIDKDQTRELFQKVAKHANENLAAVQHSKGVCYKNEYGVRRDLVEAAKWYHKAAEQGFAPAQNSIGLCYASGEGVPKDDQKAWEWYCKAADQGYAISQSNIGRWYAIGRVVEKNDKKAVEWYRKAAEQGYANARYYLSNCYKYGIGVPRNDFEAVKWLQLAAVQGNSTARDDLGIYDKDSDGYTPMMRATRDNDFERIKFLLALDFNVNYALIEAAKVGSVEAVKELIKLGADVNADDEYTRELIKEPGWELVGWKPWHHHTPLMYAAREGHLDVVKELITHGADLNRYGTIIFDPDWKHEHELCISNGTALVFAVHNNHFAVIEELVKLGANVNVEVRVKEKGDVYGVGKVWNGTMPLLLYAAVQENTQPKTIKCLLDSGATSCTSVKVSRSERESTPATTHGFDRDGNFYSATIGSTSSTISVYKTYNLPDDASSPEKKALLEAAMKKWDMTKVEKEWDEIREIRF